MKNCNKKLLVILSLVILCVLFINVSTSQALENWIVTFPTCFEPGNTTPCSLTDVISFAQQITRAIMGVAASLALLFVIYGGVLWLVSAGNAEMVTKGKKALVGSLIGVLIIVGSWVLINLLIIGLTGQELSSIGKIFGKEWYKVEGERKEKLKGLSEEEYSEEYLFVLAEECQEQCLERETEEDLLGMCLEDCLTPIESGSTESSVDITGCCKWDPYVGAPNKTCLDTTKTNCDEKREDGYYPNAKLYPGTTCKSQTFLGLTIWYCATQ